MWAGRRNVGRWTKRYPLVKRQSMWSRMWQRASGSATRCTRRRPLTTQCRSTRSSRPTDLKRWDKRLHSGEDEVGFKEHHFRFHLLWLSANFGRRRKSTITHSPMQVHTANAMSFVLDTNDQTDIDTPIKFISALRINTLRKWKICQISSAPTRLWDASTFSTRCWNLKTFFSSTATPVNNFAATAALFILQTMRQYILSTHPIQRHGATTVTPDYFWSTKYNQKQLKLSEHTQWARCPYPLTSPSSLMHLK